MGSTKSVSKTNIWYKKDKTTHGSAPPESLPGSAPRG
jgi:hypothetical protein